MNIDSSSKINFTVDDTDDELITFSFVDGVTLSVIGDLRISRVHAEAFLSSIQTVFRTHYGQLEQHIKATTHHENGSGTLEFRE